MIRKDIALQKIAREIERCKICKQGKSGKAVPGEGSSNAKVVFIGEAPGKQEAKTGRPFVGRSGQLLRSLIGNIGLSENEVFITSPVKYLPDRRTPTRADIVHGRIHLLKQLAAINPRIVVLLGSVAAQALFGESVSVTKKHGSRVKKEGRVYFFTFHPAAGLRFPKAKQSLLEDFQELRHLLVRYALGPGGRKRT